MTFRKLLLAFLIAIIVPISPTIAASDGHGKKVSFNDLAKGKVTIDPNKAYIFMALPDKQFFQAVFLKIPDEQDLAEDKTIQDENLAKATAKWEEKAANWDKQNKAGRATGARPDHPTLGNLDVGVFDPMFLKPVLILRPQESGKSTDNTLRYYLIEVLPGDYVYYGPAAISTNNIKLISENGQCFCMGAFGFSVKAGSITNVGNLLAQIGALELNPALIDFAMAPELAQYPSTPVRLFAYGKLNNPRHLIIGRSPPIVGILGYDRDIPLDLTAEDEVATDAVAVPLDAVLPSSEVAE